MKLFAEKLSKQEAPLTARKKNWKKKNKLQQPAEKHILQNLFEKIQRLILKEQLQSAKQNHKASSHGADYENALCPEHRNEIFVRGRTSGFAVQQMEIKRQEEKREKYAGGINSLQ